MPGLISEEYQAGAEIKAGDWTLVPFVRTWRLRAPGNKFGITWSRPSAVLARHPDGQEQIVPVRDYTRRVICSLVGVSLGVAILFWVLARVRRR